MSQSKLKVAKLLRAAMLVAAFIYKVLPKRKITNPSNILVMVYGGVGDAIMTIPTLALLREKKPNAKITLLASTASGGQAIYRAFPQFYDDIIVMSPTPTSWKEAIAQNLMLMRKQFDCVLISYISAYSLSLLLPALMQIPTRQLVFADRHPLRRILEMLFKERTMLLWESETRPEILIHQEILRGISKNYEPTQIEWRWKLIISDEAKSAAKDWLKENALWNELENTAKPFAVVHIGASETQNYKRYPIGKMAEALHTLSTQGLSVVVVGTPNESESLQELQFASHEKIHGCFQLELRAMCALIGQATLFLGNDSGLGHISILVDTPTIRIFGPSFYWGFRQWKKGNVVDIFRPIACSPCLRLGVLNNQGLNAHNCKHRDCLNQIASNEISDTIQTVLDNNELTKNNGLKSR